MECRALGRTGLRISVIAFGCGPVSGWMVEGGTSWDSRRGLTPHGARGRVRGCSRLNRLFGLSLLAGRPSLRSTDGRSRCGRPLAPVPGISPQAFHQAEVQGRAGRDSQGPFPPRYNLIYLATSRKRGGISEPLEQNGKVAGHGQSETCA